MIAEFEKWANHYGYTFLDVDRSIKYPDTVDKINGVIEEIEDIIQNGYDGKKRGICQRAGKSLDIFVKKRLNREVDNL